MPLTRLQRDVLALVSGSRTADSYLAGGAALHFKPNSVRFSNDLDFFNDSVNRVASAYADDNATLVSAGYEVDTEISQPGFVRSIVRHGQDATRIDWAHDSAWRFMPPVRDPLGGFLLHDVDLAVNKTLALAGRDEPRDFVDILFVHERILPLGALVWAAVGKDPGFNPLSLLELLKRRGRHRPEEINRLDLVAPFDLGTAKTTWFNALADADEFVRSRNADELGCLYYSAREQTFIMPHGDAEHAGVSVHHGSPGGVLPQPAERSILPD